MHSNRMYLENNNSKKYRLLNICSIININYEYCATNDSNNT